MDEKTEQAKPRPEKPRGARVTQKIEIDYDRDEEEFEEPQSFRQATVG